MSEGRNSALRVTAEVHLSNLGYFAKVVGCGVRLCHDLTMHSGEGRQKGEGNRENIDRREAGGGVSTEGNGGRNQNNK